MVDFGEIQVMLHKIAHSCKNGFYAESFTSLKAKHPASAFINACNDYLRWLHCSVDL
jgi:hypothetical protein